VAPLASATDITLENISIRAVSRLFFPFPNNTFTRCNALYIGLHELLKINAFQIEFITNHVRLDNN
jgi:hypothetical protein